MDDFYQKAVVYATILILLSLITLFTFDTIQTVLLVSLLIIVVSFLVVFGIDKLTTYNSLTIKEGFVSEQDNYKWLIENDDVFDDFYSSVFTKLTQNENLIQAETAICLEEFSQKMPKDQLSILDAACGIGIGTCAFAKQGVGNVVGIDKSMAMIRYAKGTTIPNTTLTESQKQDIEFRTLDLLGPGAAAGSEFTHACLLYFAVYYFPDLEPLFRNIHFWVKPGGTLVVEVVNKYKFEPILDSSNPWVGTSPQRYVKERITKSHAVFDKFDYESVFELDDPKAEFRETFRFKNGNVRRQKHILYMPSIPDIIKKAEQTGWTYTKYVDLMPLSFQYGYLLFFTRNE